MRIRMSNGGDEFESRLARSGVSRRDFMKFCASVAMVMGWGAARAEDVYAALAQSGRPPVIWLSLGECTGCTEALLRTVDPGLEALLFDVISLEYHEALMAGAGHQIEDALYKSVEKNKGKFICVIDGAIPTKDNGVYGMIGGHTMLDIAKKVCPQAGANVAVGVCAAYGGIPAAKPNPTGAKGVKDAIGIDTINVTGCPPNPLNMIGTFVHFIKEGKAPKLDNAGRPLMFFGETVHDKCPRLPHFEKDEFVKSFDSEEAKKGWCLYQVGCKGPFTYNNCPTAKFNQTSWPIQVGHPCIGCSEPGFWDEMSPFYETTG